MPRVLIFDSNVEAGMPSFAAAPELPDTRPFASARAASIISRSWSRILLLREVLGPLEAGGCPANQLLSTAKTPDSLRITDRSITFWSSRMLPGPEQLLISSNEPLSIPAH